MRTVSGLLRSSLSGEIARAIVVAWVMAALAVPFAFAISSIVFGGPLLPFVAAGAGMMMFGTSVMCLLSAWTSSYRGLIAGPQDVPAALLGSVGVAVAGSMSDVASQAAFMTMVALLILSSVVTGLVFLAIGHLRLAELFRLIPYPLMGGFLAGTGWIITLAAVSMMSGEAPAWQTLPRLFDTEVLWKWAPGAGYGFALIFTMRRFGGATTLLWSIVLVTGVYHLVLFALGISPADASAMGLLVSGIPDGGLWPPFGPGDFAEVEWSVVAEHIPNVLVVAIVALVGLVMNANGLEVATGEDLDLDREFRVAGYAGAVAGAGGSAPGSLTIMGSLASRKMGAGTPWTGTFMAVWLCLALVLGGKALEFLPNAVIGGIMLFVGFDLLFGWLVEVRKRVNWADYGTIVLIAATIAVLGFLEGFGVGILAALILFAARMARMDPIESTLTGETLRSHKVRSVPERAMLVNEADRIRIFRLQGYLFFGSAYRLMAGLSGHRSDPVAPSFVVLDCTSVLGIDASAINVLAKYLRAAQENAVEVVICTKSARLKSNVGRNLPRDVWDRIRFEADLDHALEWCEDRTITEVSRRLASAGADSRGALLEQVADELERHLDRQIVFEELAEKLGPWSERRAYETGEMLISPDGAHEGMQLLVSGRASVHDAQGRRLRQLDAGSVLEERAESGSVRVASRVVADEACVTMMLTAAGRRVLEATDPGLCLELYRYVISER